MTISYELIRALAPGRFCSGEALAYELGVTRNAVWKRVASLRAAGIDVHAVRGKGYRLADPMELLTQDSMLADFDPVVLGSLAQLEILDSVDSTNSYLMKLARRGGASGTAVFSEWQSAGRGRRGRSWVSPWGANLYFSVLWRFDPAPQNIQLLGLALAAALAQRFDQTLGLDGIRVKWPNDLYYDNRKLAGILLEVSGEAGGECVVVAGVGVNVAMPCRGDHVIDQPWTDLSRAAGASVSRNRAASIALQAVLDALGRFAICGFNSFAASWDAYDLLFGRFVTVQAGAKTFSGYAAGIDDSGALIVSLGQSTERFFSGDVSVRID